jgi:hypothetical protein
MSADATLAPAPFACALIIVVAMSLAGIAHTIWMRSRWSAAFGVALDGGYSWRGARIFGANKTLRGFVVLVPAAGVAFALLGLMRNLLPQWVDAGLWSLSPAMLGALGCWAGFWFMAGELPNSFLKRRWGVAPGTVPAAGVRRIVCLAVDHVDSVIALLAAISVLVPVNWLTWAWVLLLGPVVHLGFSALLFRLGVKARFA